MARAALTRKNEHDQILGMLLVPLNVTAAVRLLLTAQMSPITRPRPPGCGPGGGRTVRHSRAGLRNPGPCFTTPAPPHFSGAHVGTVVDVHLKQWRQQVAVLPHLSLGLTAAGYTFAQDGMAYLEASRRARETVHKRFS